MKEIPIDSETQRTLQNLLRTSQEAQERINLICTTIRRMSAESGEYDLANDCSSLIPRRYDDG